MVPHFMRAEAVGVGLERMSTLGMTAGRPSSAWIVKSYLWKL